MFNNFIKANNEYTTLDKFIPAPYLRKSFELDFIPENAKLTVATPGFYEIYVNGENITKGYLAPYISNPNHMVCYDEYDIKDKLRAGKNAIGLVLGNGYSNQTTTKWFYSECSFRAPLSVAVKLEAKGEGKALVLESDESFKVHASPIIFDMYRLGVHYDARLEIPGWCDAEFDDSSWDNASIAPTPLGELVPCYAHPIKARAELPPRSIEKQENFCYYKTELYDGQDVEETRVKEGYLYDFGINTSGVCRLKIKGKRGQKITLRHAERLGADGKFNINTIFFGFSHKHNPLDDVHLFQSEVYILKGGEEEIFTPAFTYHGFRYVLVEGITEEQATSELLTYVVFSSDVKKRADFKCSSPTINTLYDMTVNADLSNFHYFLTDCPHREKNGWTGDASVSAEQVFLSFDCADSLKLWMKAMRYTQRDDGMLPGVVPTEKYGYTWGNGPMWDSAAVNVPFAAYKYDGRLDLFSESAEMIDKYLHYIAGRRDADGLIACGLGDWCQPGKAQGVPIKAPLELTDSVTVYDIAQKSASMFEKIGKYAEADYARRLASELKQAIRTNLIDYETMTAKGDCQTSQVYLLAEKLFEDSEYETAYRRLIEIINRDGRILDTGMIGLRYIFEVLILGGDMELALELMLKKNAPSYMSMIERGATALCEALEEGSPNASENHHFFGDIIRVFTEYIAGLRYNPSLSCENEFLFAPIIPKDMDFAKAEYKNIRVEWKRNGEKIDFYADVPKGFYGRFIYKNKEVELKEGSYSFTEC